MRLPTEKGKALINQVHHTLKDVALTASWEQQLADIQDGTQPADSFSSAITTFVQDIFHELIDAPPAPMVAAADPNAYGPCPKCKIGIVRKTKMGAGCSRFKDGCTFSIWAEMNGKKLTENHVRQLVSKGQTLLIKGLQEEGWNRNI